MGQAPAAGDATEPEPGGALRVASIIGALVAFALLLTPLGFQLTMLGLLLVLFFAFDRTHVGAKLAWPSPAASAPTTRSSGCSGSRCRRHPCPRSGHSGSRLRRSALT